MGNIHSAVLERATRVQETSEEEMRTLGYAVREELRNLAEDPSKRTLYKLLHTDNRKEINQPIGEARRQMEAAAAAAAASNRSENQVEPIDVEHKIEKLEKLEEKREEGSGSLPNSPRLVIDEANEMQRTSSPANSQGSSKEEEEIRPRVNSMCMHPKKKFLEGYRNRSNTVSASTSARASPAPETSTEEDFRNRTQSVSALHSLKKRAIAAEKAKQEKDEPGMKTLNIRTCINAILESQLVRNKLVEPLDEREEPCDPRAADREKPPTTMAEMGIHGPLLMLAAQVNSMRPLPVNKAEEEAHQKDPKYSDADRYPSSRVATIRPITQPPRVAPTATISSAKDYNVEVRNPFDDTQKPPPMPALVPHPQQLPPKNENSVRSGGLEDKVRMYEMTHRQMLSREIQKVYAGDSHSMMPREQSEVRYEEKEWNYHPQTPSEREDILRESRRTMTFDKPKHPPMHRSRSPLHREEMKDAPLDLSSKSQDRSGTPPQRSEKAFMPRPQSSLYSMASRQPVIRPQIPAPIEKPRPQPQVSAERPSLPSLAASRVTVGSLLGEHSPSDILYLRCNLCESTYGSLHSFRKHFSKAHGHEPSAEHITIQTISATKDAIDRASKSHLEPVAEEGEIEKQTALQNLNLLPSNQYYESQLSRYKTGRGDEGDRSPPSLSPQFKAADKTLKCPQCGMEFPTRDWGIFSRHVRSHETGELYKCQFCGENFKEESQLAQHMAHSHPPGAPLKCRLCDAKFEVIEALSVHLQTAHHRESEGQYRCHFCPKSFVHESGLIAHMNEHAAEIHRKRSVPQHTFSPSKSEQPSSHASMYSRRMSFSENMRKDFKRPASRDSEDSDYAKRPRSGSFPNALDFFERKIDHEHRRTLNGTPDKVMRLPQSHYRPEAWRHLHPGPKRPSISEEEERKPPQPQTARSLIDEMVESAVSELDASAPQSGSQTEKILPRLFKGDPMEKVWMKEEKEKEAEKERERDRVMSPPKSTEVKNVDFDPRPQPPTSGSVNEQSTNSTPLQPQSQNVQDENVSRLRLLMTEKPVFGAEREKPAPAPQEPESNEPSSPEGLQSMRQICDQIIAKSLSNFETSKDSKNDDDHVKDTVTTQQRPPSTGSVTSVATPPPPRHPKSWDPRFKNHGETRSPSPGRASGSPASVCSGRSLDERPSSVKSEDRI